MTFEINSTETTERVYYTKTNYMPENRIIFRTAVAVADGAFVAVVVAIFFLCCCSRIIHFISIDFSVNFCCFVVMFGSNATPCFGIEYEP